MTLPAATHLPVIMLTVAETPEETALCTALGCHATLTKPVDSETWVETMRNLELVVSGRVHPYQLL